MPSDNSPPTLAPWGDAKPEAEFVNLTWA